LEDEARGLRDQGVDVLASLLTPDEVRELDLLGEADACRAAGITFVSHPVPDRGLPVSPEAFRDVVLSLAAEVGRGSSVAVHCRQGVGRAAMLAAAILAARGLPVTAAFERVAAARGCPVPDTTVQRAWVAAFAARTFPTPTGLLGDPA
jgi:protein-tyrosine phosphatase